MTHADVEALLGKPSSVHQAKKPSKRDGEPAPSAPQGDHWQYGDTLSSFATGAVFPDEADERAWCVFFGPDGKVTSFRSAGWAGRAR